jgi:biopolymer transport protein ExbB
VNDLTRFTRRVPIWLLAALLVAGVTAAAVAKEDPAPGAAEEVRKSETPRMSFLELLLKGRWFMVPIGLCSLMGLAIIIERLIALRRKAVIPPGFLDGLKAAFRHGSADRAAGIQYCQANDSPMSRVAAAGVRKIHQGEQAVEHAIEDAGANEVSKLRRNLRMLYGVAAVAPMLGLLGTVWGMIQAFQVASEGGLGRAENLATGIYEALVTTFAGLLVAIPALIFYYHFLGRIDRLVHEINEVSVAFVEHYLGEPAPAAA